jgi:hypothetical protein
MSVSLAGEFPYRALVSEGERILHVSQIGNWLGFCIQLLRSFGVQADDCCSTP